MADESKVLGIRLDAEERKRFDDFVAEEGKNNKDFLGTLLNLYELNKGKVKNINLVGDIEQLEGYTNKIQQTFVNIIDKLESQKGDIIENSNKDLQIYKDKVNNLEDKVNTINTINNMNMDKLTEVNNINTTITEQNKALSESLADKTSLIEQYKAKNDDLLSIVAEYKQYKVDNEALKAQMEQSKAQAVEKDNTIKDKDISIKAQLKDLEQLKAQSIKDIESLTSKHKQEIEQLKKESDLNIKLAAAELKEELTNKLNNEQQKHNAEIQEYQVKYKELLGQIETSKLNDSHRKNVKTKQEPKTIQDSLL